MRLAWLVLAALVPVVAPAQVWEKLIAPGIVYHMEVDNSVPRVVHAIRFSSSAPNVKAVPTLAQGTVFGQQDDRKGREVLTETVKKGEALIGVNGDFFPWTGDPLGAMVRDGELVSRPFPGRSVFAWSAGFGGVSRLTWTGQAGFKGATVELDGLNELCSKNKTVLNTSWAGYALAEGANVHVILDIAGPLTPTCKLSGKVVATVTDEDRVPVGRSQMVVTATGADAARWKSLVKGDEVTLDSKTQGLDWSRAKNVVGGGPVIVVQGKPVIAWDAEDFNTEFATKRHPRTAIGSTANGDVWIAVIEGRQTLSVGATIEEAGVIMARLGCRDAVNLDGGGSSELVIGGAIVNRPSDGSERPLANCVLLFGEPVPLEDGEYVIQGKARLAVGSATDYKVVDGRGKPVPGSTIVWTATGDAWIDQSGRLRALQPGKATVQALVGGKVLKIVVTLEAPPKAGSKG
ncbi:MAG: phosphodiester glycosidase family protein [Armatimonadetes bacterium]|nr:phosphodiester glycosidase family protein [Armatimonadota bacterium]